jgi:hypothetical protein
MKTIFRIRIPMIIALISLTSLSCTKYQIPGRELAGPGDPDAEEIVSTCDPDTVYFSNDVLPLVVSSCATTGCHSKDSHREGVILTDYSSILRTGGIKPGDPNDSKFLETLTDNGEDRMPPSPSDPWNSEQIEMMRQWIAQGAQNNACSDGCDTSNVTFSGQIWPMMEKYCTGCHSAGSAGGGIVISGYDDMVALAGNGNLMGSIRYEPGYAKMPTNQQLSECNINLLQKWIDDGFSDL